MLRPNTGEPSSDSGSIPEATAHLRLCCSTPPPRQCLPPEPSSNTWDPAEQVEAVANLPLRFRLRAGPPAPCSRGREEKRQQAGTPAARHRSHQAGRGKVRMAAGLNTACCQASSHWHEGGRAGAAGGAATKDCSPSPWFPPIGKQLLH